jgi:outer membrane protein assembly factor BamB
MKRLLICIFCFQLLVMTGSCQKPIPPEPPPKQTKPPKPPISPTTNLEIVWLAPFCSDSTGGWIWDFEVANEQYIVVANTRERNGGRPRGIGVYNMQIGQRHLAWQNDPGGIFAPTDVENLMDCKVSGKNKDIILIYNRRAVFGYSLHSGQRMWTSSIKNQTMGVPHMSADKDYAYISYSPTGAFSKSWNRLAKIDVYSGKQTDILELYIEDNYEFDINPPSSYVTSQGDTLLYFTVDALNFEINDGRGYVYCYNMTKKQMVWENKQFTTDIGASTIQPPPFVIENDKLIITGRHVICCLNRHTGELIWQRENLSLADRPPLYYEGKLYIRSGDPCILMCLDAQNGQILWENTTLNPIPAPHGRMAVYKERLYFTAWGYNATYHLACIDIHTGQELWRDRGPWDIAFDVLIDEKTGYLYCYTGFATMCVDLNKTPKK